jgi:hypothetical protein
MINRASTFDKQAGQLQLHTMEFFFEGAEMLSYTIDFLIREESICAAKIGI